MLPPLLLFLNIDETNFVNLFFDRGGGVCEGEGEGEGVSASIIGGNNGGFFL